MSKRQVDDGSFEAYKDAIVKLYVQDNQPLSEVMKIMARQGFSRTKSQYELNFKTWGLTKNVKKEEWKYIVARLQEREAQGKRSIVAVNGNAVPKAKIQKQRKLYEYQDTYQRFASNDSPARRPPTPNSVSVHTPIPSPLLEDANLHSGYTNKTVSEDGGAPLGLKSEMSTEVVLGSPEVRSQALSILRGDPPASLTPASCLSKFWFLLWFEMCEGENDSLQTRRGT